MADYRKAGVDRKKADLFVEGIAKLAKSTLNPNVKSSIGGYASLYRTSNGNYLAATTDGVGTKLKLAFDLGRHDTVGIDLVAMSVNDLLCVGSKPLFFLDYFATGKLKTNVGAQVLKGIVAGCKEAECALVGGETAEMPGFYANGEYDLAGFAVGEVAEKALLPKKKVPAGSVLIGLPSSGFHSNGFSLLRKHLPTGAAGKKLAKTLLSPTRIYVEALKNLLGHADLLGLSHITGSGFLNVPRISEGVSYSFKLPPLAALPPGMAEMFSRMGLSFEEEATTFNCGIGMVLAVRAGSEQDIIKRLNKNGEAPVILGETIKYRAGRGSEIHVLRKGSKDAWIQS